MEEGYVQISVIGSRIRSERERLKLGVEEFASGAGVSGRSQRNYESGERLPDAAYMARASSMGADVDFILTGERSVWRTLAESVNQECEVLARVLASVDAAMERAKIELPAAQKASCIVHIYRNARWGAPSDEQVINEVLALATAR